MKVWKYYDRVYDTKIPWYGKHNIYSLESSTHWDTVILCEFTEKKKYFYKKFNIYMIFNFYIDDL